MTDQEPTRPLPYDPYHSEWRGVAQPPPPAMAPDTIEFGHPDDVARPRRRKVPIVITLVVVLTLIMGGAAVAGAYVWYGWGSTQPEQVLPGSVSAFARLDLSPGLGQRLTISNLVKKFPRENASKDQIEEFKQGVLRSLGLAPLNYDTDVAPWFGDRLGVALWAPSQSPKQGAGSVCPLVALASKDDAKAKVALEKMRRTRGAEEYSFAFSHGYAITAECPGGDARATADAAVAAAQGGSLAQRPEFADELRRLPAGQVAIGWADLGALSGLAKQITGEAKVLGSGLQNQSGQVLAGIRAVDNGIELRYRWRGAKALRGSKDVLFDLGAMPADTGVAAAIDLSALGQVNAALQEAMTNTPVDAQTSVVRDGTRALLGSVVSLAIADADISKDTPAFRLTVQAPDAAQAQAAGELIHAISTGESGGSGGSGGPAFDLKRDGSRIDVTVGDYPGGSGSLGQDPLYQEAMAGATGSSTVGIFVNLRRILASAQLEPKDRQRLQPIQAIGVTGGVDGDTLVGLLRVVIK